MLRLNKCILSYRFYAQTDLNKDVIFLGIRIIVFKILLCYHHKETQVNEILILSTERHLFMSFFLGGGYIISGRCA